MPEPIDTSTLGPVKLGAPPKSMTIDGQKLVELQYLLADNLEAWEGEEDSVQEEHADLIERLQKFELKS